MVLLLWACYPLIIPIKKSDDRESHTTTIRQLTYFVHIDNLSNIALSQLLNRHVAQNSIAYYDHKAHGTDTEVNTQSTDNIL